MRFAKHKYICNESKTYISIVTNFHYLLRDSVLKLILTDPVVWEG